MLKHKIICGKSETELKQFDDNSFDSCVTDPPYGLEFMGKDWDRFNDLSSDNTKNGYFSHGMKLPNFYNLKNTDLLSFQQFTYQWATELYRIMKPGAHILIFGGTRTYHRMACAVEDAGFECRDMLSWNYGSGFPKSLDIGKAVLKLVEKELKKQGVGEILWK